MKVGPRCRTFKIKKGLFPTKTRSTNKRHGRAGSSKILEILETMKTKEGYENKTMNKYMSKTMRQEPDLTSQLWHEVLVRILQ